MQFLFASYSLDHYATFFAYPKQQKAISAGLVPKFQGPRLPVCEYEY